MNTKPKSSLYTYTFAAFLLVLAVAGGVFYLAEQVFSPIFTTRNLGSTLTITEETLAACELATRQTMFWSLGVAGLVASSLSVFVTRYLISPLKAMQRASQAVASGQYHRRLTEDAPGEVGELAQAFNAMAYDLERTEQRRAELLSNVTHELGTPLSSLQIYLEGIEDGIFGADTETLTACKRQLEHLERLVDDLSLLSRLQEHRESDLNLEPIVARELLARVIAAFRPQFDRKRVSLTLGVNANSLTVLADAERVTQVFNNLLANALRYTSPGGHVSLSVQTQRDGYAKFLVQDSGEGIPEAALPHLFRRFYRVDKSRSRATDQGSGLGLTIAKHYVDAHGGHIGVHSQLEKGTCFWFTLPEARAAVQPSETPKLTQPVTPVINT